LGGEAGDDPVTGGGGILQYLAIPSRLYFFSGRGLLCCDQADPACPLRQLAELDRDCVKIGW
jgi:hypothetical protein